MNPVIPGGSGLGKVSSFDDGLLGISRWAIRLLKYAPKKRAPGPHAYGPQALVLWISVEIISLYKVANSAPHPDQARRLQVLRRSHSHSRARPAGRHRRAQRLRQIERHRRRALGARRILGEAAARRNHAGRDLQRLRRAQARKPRQRRADFRQQPRQGWPGRGRNTRKSRSSACSSATASRPTSSTTCMCAGATSPTSSSAPASARAPTRSSSRA